MPRARMGTEELEVRVTRDLGESWTVEIAPIPREPPRSEIYKPAPARIVVKLRATGRDAAATSALQMLKEAHRIDDFTV